jgi:ABC-type branched-subunit amino acid transport system substrate-binding protein
VIATLSGPEGDLDESFLDGMTLARERVNRDGGIGGRGMTMPLVADDGRDPADLLREALAERPAAVMFVGSAEPVIEVRPEIEATGVPVIVLGGDLYTGRHLHRYVFQTAVPWTWQARVLASYLLEDRGHERVVVITEGTSAGDEIAAAFSGAFSEEGGDQPQHAPVARARYAADVIGGVDAAVLAFPPTTIGRALGRISPRGDIPQIVLPAEGVMTKGWSREGTVACYPYTWAGWADMLPRVHEFRGSFAARFGEPPSGLEQEGYDAVMAIAEALRATGGRGGDTLVRELETFREQTYASVPVRLGPDDHVFAEQSHLGLFTVADPAGAPEGESFGDVPWRPLLRTFTTDGEKVNFLDRDKKIFFPFWHKKRPTPKYWRSGYGILDRRGEGPA